MGKPSAPAPPDPRETSAAATGTNIGTAIANNTMTLVDQYGPNGSLTYGSNGTQTYTDPYTNQVYEIPRYTATTTYSPGEQAIADQNTTARTNLAATAADQSGFLRDYLASPANTDTSATEARLDELMRARADPRFAREESSLRNRLTQQGLAPGSEAYNRELESFGQTKNDAYNSMYLNGRGQAQSEMYAARNQPINEISALLSGSQVNQPNFAQSQPQGAATTDVAGIINQNYNQRLQNYNQQNSQRQGLLGGLFGLGASAISGGLF